MKRPLLGASAEDLCRRSSEMFSLPIIETERKKDGP